MHSFPIDHQPYSQYKASPMSDMFKNFLEGQDSEEKPTPAIHRCQGSITRKAAYLLTFVAGAAGMFAVDRSIQTPKPHDGPPPLKRPHPLAPEERESPDHLHISGTTEAAPGRIAKISLATNQAVAFVDVKLGDPVKKGWQVFSHWESPEGLEAIKGEITRAKGAIAAASARSDAAHQALTRLTRARNAVTAQELEDAQALATVRAAELSAAEATLDIAELRFAEADFHFQQAFVTSPIDGVVVDVSVTPGERRQIGGPFRGIVILDPRVLSVRCTVPPAQLLTLQRMSRKSVEGLHATVECGGKSYPATLKTVGLRADDRTRNIPVLLEVQNPAEELRCGILVTVTLSPKK